MISHVCRPEVNQRISKAAHIKELNSEIDKLKEELFATREKNGVYLPADHWESQQVNSLLHYSFLSSRQLPPSLQCGCWLACFAVRSGRP